MSMSRRLVLVLAALPGVAAAQVEGPGLGRPVSEAELAALDISIPPDGAGLPPGSGGAAEGAQVYAQLCQACHGPAGEGGDGLTRLTGGVGTLATQAPVKTVNSFWPYATGVFDYVRRAMPPTAPQSLTPDQIYAVTAYILSVDGVVAPDAILDAQSLPDVEMPNRDGFVPWWPEPGGE